MGDLPRIGTDPLVAPKHERPGGSGTEEIRTALAESRRLFASIGLFSAESGDFRIVVSGDSIITRRMRVFREPDFLKLVELLRGSDVSVTNAEILFHYYEDPPTTTSGGTYMRRRYTTFSHAVRK